MSLYAKLRTSPKLETEGVALELANARIQVARAGGQNQKYNAAAEKIARKHKRAVDNDLLTNEVGRKLLYELYAEHVVLDWQTNTGTAEEPNWVDGIEMPDGTIGEVTFENIVSTFTNLPDLFTMVQETSTNLTYFRQGLVEGAVKN